MLRTLPGAPPKTSEIQIDGFIEPSTHAEACPTVAPWVEGKSKFCNASKDPVSAASLSTASRFPPGRT